MADTTEDVTFVYTAMIGYHPNNLTVVIVGHFLIEYLINKIIFNKCQIANRISKYSFSTKVDFLNAMALLPNDLYKNIKKINKIRNKIVHALEIDLKPKDMDFYKSSGQKIIINKPKSRDPEKHYFKMLLLGTLTGLRNYMLLTLKISPDFKF